MDASQLQVLLLVLVSIALALWFILPAYIANMMPALLHKFFGRYNFPVDFGRNFFDGKRILGDGKTWNGLLAGVLAGTLMGFLQGNYFAGFVLGTGALFGDLVKSFLKRRLGFARGKMWFPFDQIDFVFGAFLFYYLFFREFILSTFVILIILTPVLHLLTNLIGFKLKLKKEPW